MNKRKRLGKLKDKARQVSEELRETTASKKVRDVANSTKIRDAAASVKGPVQDASKKASDLGIATAEQLKFGSRKSLDAIGSAANVLLSTTPALLANNLSGEINGLMQNMVKGSPTIYDKAMDAEFIATHIGGAQHRLFDGGHTISALSGPGTRRRLMTASSKRPWEPYMGFSET